MDHHTLPTHKYAKSAKCKYTHTCSRLLGDIPHVRDGGSSYLQFTRIIITHVCIEEPPPPHPNFSP